MDPSGEALTPREEEVVALAARRWTSREIADELGLSLRTVDNHLLRAYRKLGVSSRRQLVQALRPGPGSGQSAGAPSGAPPPTSTGN